MWLSFVLFEKRELKGFYNKTVLFINTQPSTSKSGVTTIIVPEVNLIGLFKKTTTYNEEE